MAKGYAQGRTPNETRDVVTLPDGSTWDPGFVQFPDGTDAAVAERHYDSEVARGIRDAAAQRANHGDAPSYEELTQLVQEQRRVLRDYVAPYRSTSQDPRAPGGPQELLYGRVVTLNAGQKVQGIYTPELHKPEVWTVYVQPQLETDQKTPFASAYGHGDLSSIIVNLQWCIGGCTFSRSQVIQTANVTRFQVVAKKVMIDLTAFKVGDPTLGGKTFLVNLAVGCGQENEIFSVNPLWISPGSPGGAGSGASQLLLPNASIPIPQGMLLSAVVTAKAVPGAGGPWYPMFFNQPQAPVNGDPPFLVLPPIAAAGGVSTADDEFAPSWDYDNGLAFGFSTTPDTFTAPAAGSVLRIDYKVGT